MMSSTKRLQILGQHLAPAQTAGSTQGKTFISTNVIKDGDKSYPEIIDYHPEKKVSERGAFGDCWSFIRLWFGFLIDYLQYSV